MATSTWIPPLPPGYEARWDPNQKAYFFINHSTKTTSWQDPRWAAQGQGQPQAQSQSHQAQAQHSAAAHSLNKGFSSSDKGQNVAMKTMYKQYGGTTTRADTNEDDDWEDDWESDSETELPFSESTGDQRKVDIAKLHQLKQMFPHAPEESIKNALLTNNNVMGMAQMQLSAAGYKKEERTSHPPPRQVDMLERLRAMFPTANPGLVSDILHQARYDEKSARAQLEAIGYKAQYTPTHKSSSAHKSSRDTSPVRRSISPAKSPAKQASPTKVTLSEAEKSRVLSKMKNEFRETEESVITMALQVCDYDETRVKNLLERMKTESEAPRPSSSRTTVTERRSASPTPVVSPASLEPVAFEFDVSSNDSRPKKSTSGTSSSRTTPDRKTPTKTPTKTSRTPTPKSSTSSARQQQRTKNVTELSEDVLSSTVDVLNHLATNVSCCHKQGDQSDEEEDLLAANQNEADRHRQKTVVSRQPQAGSYVSPYRTVAKGPDYSLRVGPNKDLLIKEYVLAKGPNPDLRQGPDPNRVMGSQGAVGPDPSLRCGPQAGLSQGSSVETLLVTTI